MLTNNGLGFILIANGRNRGPCPLLPMAEAGGDSRGVRFLDSNCRASARPPLDRSDNMTHDGDSTVIGAFSRHYGLAG
jgi:hypothetical protein